MIYPNPGVAIVFKDLLIWRSEKGYWEKLNLPEVNNDDTTPAPRFDHRGILWKKDTLVYYGGSYQSVDDCGDIWMLNTSMIDPTQIIKAPAEGACKALGPPPKVFYHLSLAE